MRVLITGASGFVGRALCETLARSGHILRATVRDVRSIPVCVAERVIIGDMSTAIDWGPSMSGVDTVVHAAARAHVMRDPADSAELYLDTNARATRRIAEAAAAAGVRRFVYLSSIKVNGEETSGSAYTPLDAPNPQDAYGMSKLLGEKSVLDVSTTTGMQVAIVRPPLVYGPGVRSNFLRLMRWVDAGWPLPLGSVRNRRSLVSIWNLCDLLARLLDDPLPSGRIWLVSDSEDLSTPDLIRRIGTKMERTVRLLPIPPRLLQGAAMLAGKKAEFARLCGSLTVDISETRNELRWSPPVTVNESLARTVRWYLSGLT